MKISNILNSDLYLVQSVYLHKICPERCRESTIPDRCFLTKKVIGEGWQQYILRVQAWERPDEVLKDLDLLRYYCTQIFISTVELVEKLMKDNTFKKTIRDIDQKARILCALIGSNEYEMK